MKIALSYYYYALSGRKTAHTFAESALVQKATQKLRDFSFEREGQHAHD